MSWHKYWLIWFAVWFTAFIGPETYCLVKANGGTLSESIWWLEGWRRGDVTFTEITQWSAGHVLFGGLFVLIFGWLAGHFLFRVWR